MAKVEPELLSIGDICSETGLSADVVRVWERRYGFPVPVRLPSGHRRYRQTDLHQLRGPRLRQRDEALAANIRQLQVLDAVGIEAVEIDVGHVVEAQDQAAILPGRAPGSARLFNPLRQDAPMRQALARSGNHQAGVAGRGTFRRCCFRPGG